MAHSNHPVKDYESALGADALLIDVRPPDGFATGTLPGAKNVPLPSLLDQLGDTDSAQRVVLVCRSGATSTKASEMLTAAGFTDVVNLEGGMLAYNQG